MKQTYMLLSTLLCTIYAADLTASKEIPKNQVSQKVSIATSFLKSGNLLHLDEFTKMQNGIAYKIIKKGSGVKPKAGQLMTVNYSGFLPVYNHKKNGASVVETGFKFDSSFDRNTPFNFRLGAGMVISGWDISLADMLPGETRIVILPSNLAYGSRTLATIPANSNLIFEITLLKAS